MLWFLVVVLIVRLEVMLYWFDVVFYKIVLFLLLIISVLDGLKNNENIKLYVIICFGFEFFLFFRMW